MVIAINTKITGREGTFENSTFISQVFSRIIASHTEHIFIIIGEKKECEFFSSFSNVIPVMSRLQKKSPVQWYLWLNINLSSILKKYKADLLINNGLLASLTAKIPQYIIVPGLHFVNQPETFRKNHLLFYRSFFPRSLKKVRVIFTLSQFCKTEINKLYKIDESKIKVIYSAINENFRERSYEEKERIKIAYANGNEYFIYTGEIGLNKNLMNLLKAFSAFKKRQKSSMQLCIAGKKGYKYDKFLEELRFFRFKNDVKILNDLSLDELATVTAASYCMVYPSKYECFSHQPLQALQSGVPAIVDKEGAMPEILGDAALYADVDNFKEMAIHMMTLFKNEMLRKEFVEKGKLQANNYSWDNTATLLWKEIEH